MLQLSKQNFFQFKMVFNLKFDLNKEAWFKHFKSGILFIYNRSLALFQHKCMVWHTCTSHITTLHVASRCILRLIYCSSNMKFVFISYQHIHFCDTHANVLIIIDHHISFIFAICELLQLHDVCNPLENSYQGVLSCLAILLQ